MEEDVFIESYMLEDKNVNHRNDHFVNEMARVLSSMAAEVGSGTVSIRLNVLYSALIDTDAMNVHIQGAENCRRTVKDHISERIIEGILVVGRLLTK